MEDAADESAPRRAPPQKYHNHLVTQDDLT